MSLNIQEIALAYEKATQEFLDMFKTISMYCFEPEPKNIKIVKDTITNINHHFFEGVVSDIDGQVTFNRSRMDDPAILSYSGSIKKPKEHLN